MEEAHAIGVKQVPQFVLDQLRVNVRFEHEIRDADTPKEQAEIVARMYDELHGTNLVQTVRRYSTNGEASAFIEGVRPQLYPAYTAWQRAIDKVIDARLAAQG